MIALGPHETILLNVVADRYGLDLVLLFGSQVTGKTHSESDYDIGYVSTRHLTVEEQARFILDLMPVLRVKDERLIDIANLRRVTPLLLYRATADSLVLFEREPTVFARLAAYAYKQYVETMPLRRLKYERIRRALPQPVV